MGITVVTPAADYRLAVVEDLRDELGITTRNEDRRLSRLLLAASRTVERITRRAWVEETVDETLRGHGMYYISVSRTPVRSPLTSVTLDDSDVDVSDVVIEDAAAGILGLKSLWTKVHFSTAKENITIRYKGGYKTKKIDSSPDLPEEVEQATLEIAKALYKGTGRDPSVQSESVGDYSVTYRNSVTMAAVHELLAPWVRH